MTVGAAGIAPEPHLQVQLESQEAFWHTFDFLELCARKGITLKPEKFQFCRREAEFVGFHLDWDSYRPTDDRLAAIKKFSMPEQPSITDVRSWYGFVNQLAPFLVTAPIMEPFRDLLKKPAGRKCTGMSSCSRSSSRRRTRYVSWPRTDWLTMTAPGLPS